MSNKKQKTPARPVNKKPVQTAVEEAPATEQQTAPEVDQTPEAPKVEEAQAKIIDQNIQEATPRKPMSSVFTENRTALLFKLKQMDEVMGKGKVFDHKQAAALQRDLQRIVVNFITNVPPEEGRKAVGCILDSYHESPFMVQACMFKGVRDPRTKVYVVPEWFIDVSTIFSLTMDPEVRFSVANVTTSLDRISEGVPPAVLLRLKEFFKV